MSKRLIISEEDRRSILSQYGLLREAYDQATNTYSTEAGMIMYGDLNNSESATKSEKAYVITFPKGAKVTSNNQGVKSVLTLNGTMSKPRTGAVAVTYTCGQSTFVYFDKYSYKPVSLYSDGLVAFVNKMKGFFCTANKNTSNQNTLNKNNGTVKSEVSVNAPKDVKVFQDWLDKNKPGWLTGKPYKTLDKNPERGYGQYGPLTQAAWNKYKSEYQPNQSTTASTTSTTATTASTVATTAATAPTTATTATTVAAGTGGNPLPGLNNIQDKALRDAVLAWSKTPAGQYVINTQPAGRESALDNLDRVRGDKETRRLKKEIRTALGMMADTGLGRLGQRVQGAVQGFKNPI